MKTPPTGPDEAADADHTQANMPQAPQPPQPGDCCSSGCTFCVEDLYQEALEDYRAALSLWRQQQRP